MNTKVKTAAIKLRKKGLLYAEIAGRLHIAKSTVYVWTSKVALTERQRALVAGRLAAAKRRQMLRLAHSRRIKREQAELMTRSLAQSTLESARLSIDHKRLLCAVLFWCEGEKDVSSGIRFINSDPLMVRKFLSLLRQSFRLDESKFRALIHLHDYHNVQSQLSYWSGLTDIPPQQFYKSYQKPHNGKQSRAGYQGCISVRYVDVELGKLLKSIFVEYSKSA